MAISEPTCWRLIIDGPLSGNMNMALDEVLLMQKNDCPALRFYRWNKPTVSIGMAQNASRHINTDNCRIRGIPVVRRLTGGKAVLHHNELTYSLTGSSNTAPFSLNLLDTYCEIGKAFCKGLKNLGINAVLAPRHSAVLKAAVSSCFAAASSYEITVNGKKLLGSAQKRTHESVLQHGSLLFEYNASDWQAVMQRCPENAEEMATDLKSLLELCPSVEDVQQAICDGFQSCFGITFVLSEYTKEELEFADNLVSKKYFNLVDQLDNNSK
jgi:lipoyl(octanoyl) transferase